jgi:transcription antitermination factor NusA-like protein
MSDAQQSLDGSEAAHTAFAGAAGNRKTKIDDDAGGGGGGGAGGEDDAARKRTKVGGSHDDSVGSGLLIPAAAVAASQAAAATTAAATAQDGDILHRCLRLTDPTYVMIPVPKMFAPNPLAPLAFQLECVVPKLASGHIIGRQGAKIKQTRETSGANVKMLDHVGTAPFRCIVITGSFEQCRAAFGVIADQVNDPKITANTPVVPGQKLLTVLVPNNKVGGLIGQKGAVINEFRALSGSQIGLAKPEDMNPGALDRVVTVTGDFTQVQRAWSLISQKLATIVPTKENAPVQQRLDGGGSGGHGFAVGAPHHHMGGGGRGGGGGGGAVVAAAAQVMTQNVIVTNDQAGIIIGKGGQHINEMRRYVGCDIRVDPTKDSNGENGGGEEGDLGMRNVRIIGTPQQIQLAQSMILNKIQHAAAQQQQQQAGGGAGGLQQRQQQQQLAAPQYGVPSGHDQQYRPQQQQQLSLAAYGALF